jgi:hypothetical protein
MEELPRREEFSQGNRIAHPPAAEQVCREPRRRAAFGTAGVRALAFLPRRYHDTALPLVVHPAPEEIVRVGVIWAELE